HPMFDVAQEVLFGLPLKLDNPAAPRSRIITKFEEEKFTGNVIYHTAEGVDAVWLENLVGLNNIECLPDDPTLTLTFDSESNAKFPEVWGRFPLTALISQRYYKCMTFDNKLTLGVRKILGIKG
ncbi:hypothetical protein HDU92_004648, partial [Lobulomyces angularis]